MHKTATFIRPRRIEDSLEDDLATVLTTIAGRADAADRGETGLDADLDLLREAGLFAAILPRQAGGLGLGFEAGAAVRTVTLLRCLGRANLSVARLIEGHMNALKLIMLYGDCFQQDEAFSASRLGALFGVWGADSDKPVTIERTSAGARLNGAKRFASGLGLVDRAIVTATTPDGPQLMLLAARDPARMDASVWQTSGMRATASGIYDFDGFSVTGAAYIGKPGDYTREPHFEGGVWRYAAAQVGGMEAIAKVARTAVAGTDDPHQLRRVAELAMLCETGRLWVERAAERAEHPEADDAAVAYVLLAREVVEQTAQKVIALADRALGSRSFFNGHPVERMRRDLAFFLRQANLDGKLDVAARNVAGSPHPIGERW